MISTYPASRGFFSIVFVELMGVRKRDLCPGLKQTPVGSANTTEKRPLPWVETDARRFSKYYGKEASALG